ncbi:MAG: winged helix DNA-binding protein [Bacteroidota bacterium]
MNYRLLKEIISLLENYEDENSGSSSELEGFSRWLSTKVEHETKDARLKEAAEQGDTAITMLISYLYRYTKNYSKKALEDTPLSTFDDFAFLATLSYSGSLTKTELIQMHLLEITSGIEIIKRLSKYGYLTSFQDPNDKRSKRVKLTPMGRQVLEEVMEKMDQAAFIFSGKLSLRERADLLPVMHKLHDFHSEIFRRDRKSSLDKIKDKYLQV